MKQIKNQAKGFTIIEVVLVLAIAGLIFLMVFIALPALQRNQRDTARKNDVSRVITAVSSYQSNNRGATPTGTAAFYNNTFKPNYLTTNGDAFEDPSYGSYTFNYRGTNRAAPTTPVSQNGQIWVYSSSTCSGETITSAGLRKLAFAVKLEGGGILCQSN